MGILPKIKIKRENLVLVGLLIIALAIPLTVILLGVRQELRKGAAGVSGSIVINNGATTTSSRNVTLTLTAPTQQASLIKPNLKIPQAHAAGCTISASPNPCTVASGESLCTSTISWTSTDNIDIYVYDSGWPQGHLFSSPGPGSNSADASWIQANGDTYTFKGIIGGVVHCSVGVTAIRAASPTPTPASTCYDSDGLDQYTKGYVDYTGSDSTAPPAGRYWDECSDNGWQVNEQWCNPNSLPAVTVFNCDYGCADGTCRRSGATPTPRPPTPTPTPRPPTPTPTPRPPTPTPALTIVGMVVSNYSNFSDAAEEFFATPKSWTLTEGDGLKTVYAKFKWSNGTWTSPVSDTITLQTAGPTPTPTPTLPPGVTPTPTPTPTTPPGVTPTPTPTTPPGQTGTAVCDSLTVGPCFGGGQVPSPAWVAAHVWGHDTAGAKVAFRFILKDSKYNYVSDPIYARVGYYPGFYMCVPQKDGTPYVNPPYDACDYYVIPNEGGITKLVHLSDLAVDATYTVEAYVSSVRFTNPGSPFSEEAVVGNWSSPCTAQFSVYYEKLGISWVKHCSSSTSGTPPTFEKPVISNLGYTVTNDTAPSGYADVTVTFTTDIEAKAAVKYGGKKYWPTRTPCAAGYCYSATITHIWYNRAAGSDTHGYTVMAAKEEYWGTTDNDVYISHPEAGAYADGTFTIPSGGGGGGGGGLPASAADLNGSGDVDIGDWGALVNDYGQEGEDLPADFNGNGEVDILDVSQFINAYKTYAK